ncbi:capsular polysaccharide export protein, LipB/KpsS family [Cytobacillus kochii]|nr:capsular polysaccharide biosynthesis protein [Cytobacillus kochii]
MKRFVKYFISHNKYFCHLLYLYMFEKRNDKRKTVFVFGISEWKKKYIKTFLKEYRTIFLPKSNVLFLLKCILKRKENYCLAVWGYTENESLANFVEANNISLVRIEDGFVRSKELGAMHSPPYSLCIDKKGMYFDSTKPSDLEEILNNYNFSENKPLIERAKACIEMIKDMGVSKYNHIEKKSAEKIYGAKEKRRILVIGQVEDDASIIRGCANQITNNDLVRLAKKENPEAEIIYKPHPDVLTGCRKRKSDPEEVKHLARIIKEPIGLSDSFVTIDHVYTITSLGGFEALLRGIPVTTVGAPFYSGWGLTDDRQKISRRRRQLTVEEVFAISYLIYPVYMDIKTGNYIELEDVLYEMMK